MQRNMRATLVAGCSFAAFATIAAAAEPEDRSKAVTVGEIVVTAQFREQKLQDTPLAITALNAQALEARGVTDVVGIANSAPNVSLKPLGAGYGPSLGASIRGIGQFDFNPALEPGVGVYVDDVYYPTLTGSDMELLDLDRVEVLRGPQGTLTGRNSIGGAIRLMSKLPGASNGGFLAAGYGADNLMELRGAANMVINDQLSMRISGTHKSQDGYVRRIDYGCAFPASGVPAGAPAGDCQVGRDGDLNYTGLRGSLRWRPTEKLDVVVTADYTRSDTAPGGAVMVQGNLPAAAAPNATTTNGLPLSNAFVCGKFCNYRTNGVPAGSWVVAPGLSSVFPFNLFGGFPLSASSGLNGSLFKGAGLSASLKYEFNDNLSFQSITAYRNYDSAFDADLDLSPAHVSYGSNALHHHFFSEEVRLNGELSEQFRFTVGGYYSDQKTTYATQQDIRYAPAPLQFVGDDPIPASTKAGFATIFWTPLRDFNVTAGVRYTSEKKDYTFIRQNYDGTPNLILGSLNGLSGHYSGNHFDYRISIDYRWNPALMTYATVSTGFKGGGVSPRPFNVAQVRPFDQEQLTAYEFGAKSDTFDGRLRLNASAFFNKYTDMQLTLLNCPQFGGPGPCSLVANVGDAEMKGFELEAITTPVDGLSLNASVSYLDFDYTRLDPATGLSKGFVPPYSPRWKADFGAQYEIQLGDAGSLTPRIDVSYQGAIHTDAANAATNRIDAYALVNGNVTWRNKDGDLAATLAVTNLTDKYYYLTKFDFPNVGLVTAQPGRSREVVFRVKKTF